MENGLASTVLREGVPVYTGNGRVIKIGNNIAYNPSPNISIAIPTVVEGNQLSDIDAVRRFFINRGLATQQGGK